MAGSFLHMVGEDNAFTTDFLENGGDMIEALEECWDIIIQLTGGDKEKIFEAWRDGYLKRHCPASSLKLHWCQSAENFWAEHGGNAPLLPRDTSNT